MIGSLYNRRLIVHTRLPGWARLPAQPRAYPAARPASGPWPAHIIIISCSIHTTVYVYTYIYIYIYIYVYIYIYITYLYTYTCINCIIHKCYIILLCRGAPLSGQLLVMQRLREQPLHPGGQVVVL